MLIVFVSIFVDLMELRDILIFVNYSFLDRISRVLIVRVCFPLLCQISLGILAHNECKFAGVYGTLGLEVTNMPGNLGKV